MPWVMVPITELPRTKKAIPTAIRVPIMRVFILVLMILSFAFSQEQSAKIGIDPDLLKQNYINVDENNRKRLDNALQNALFKLEYGRKDT